MPPNTLFYDGVSTTQGGPSTPIKPHETEKTYMEPIKIATRQLLSMAGIVIALVTLLAVYNTGNKMEIITLLLLTVIAMTLSFWNYIHKPLTYWKDLGVKQSDSSWYIFGDIWKQIHVFNGKNSFLDCMTWLHRESKPNKYFGFYEFGEPMLSISDPDLLKTVLVKDFEHFVDHDSLTVEPDVDPFWASSLLILKGNHWKHMRNILSPSFTSSKMRFIYDLMVEATDTFVSYFTSLSKDNIIEFEAKDIFSRYTNDILATTAFGLKVDSLRDRNNLFYKAGLEITRTSGVLHSIRSLILVVSPLLFKLLGFTVIPKKPVAYFADAIRNTIKQREEHNIRRPDMIHILLEAKNRQNQQMRPTDRPITTKDIVSQAMIFFFAGFDTVSTGLTWTAYELAVNKHVQDKLREEIEKTAAENDKITMDVLLHMSYMDMVVNEALRKWPPFPITDRVVTKPYTLEPCNENKVPVRLQKGLKIWVPIFGIQRDPDYFPNPDKFDPERFSKENISHINPYTNIPFGIGPRVCIATRFALMEIKSLLFKLLLNFEIVPTEKTQIPPKLVSYRGTYYNDGGLNLGLKRITS